MHTFPKRALYSGASSALKFSVIEDKDNIDQACTKSLQGFKVSQRDIQKLNEININTISPKYLFNFMAKLKKKLFFHLLQCISHKPKNLDNHF